MEVRELLLEYDFLGDDILVIKGFVLGVLEGKLEWVVKVEELMDVVDVYIDILLCVIDKLFMMLVEDVFIIIGCGIVVIGCVDCGIVKVGD